MEITSFGVIGSGSMGNGIAQVAAQAGYEVTVFDLVVGGADAPDRAVFPIVARGSEG